jgi:hypothetical protein
LPPHPLLALTPPSAVGNQQGEEEHFSTWFGAPPAVHPPTPVELRHLPPNGSLLPPQLQPPPLQLPLQQIFGQAHFEKQQQEQQQH